MRFKAKLSFDRVNLLHSLLVSLSKLYGNEKKNSTGWNNGSIIELDESNFRISVAGKTADTDGMVCFVDLSTSDPAGKIFVEHRIESAKSTSKTILF